MKQSHYSLSLSWSDLLGICLICYMKLGVINFHSHMCFKCTLFLMKVNLNVSSVSNSVIKGRSLHKPTSAKKSVCQEKQLLMILKVQEKRL